MDVLMYPLVNWPLSGLFDSTIGFITVMALIAVLIGAASKNLAVGAHGGYMMFLYYAIYVDAPLINNLMYVTLILILMGVGFKFWRLEGAGE